MRRNDDGKRNRAKRLQVAHKDVVAGDKTVYNFERSSQRRPPMQLLNETSVIGRDRQFAQLNRWYENRPPNIPPVVVISGMAGVGKTAFATTWAHRVADQFPDGCPFTDLKGFASAKPMSPYDVLAGFIVDFDGPEADLGIDLEGSASRFRSLLAGKRALIGLDNVRDVDQVKHLLPGEPNCLTIITSRHRLTGLRGNCKHIQLKPLDTTDAIAVLEDLLDDDYRVPVDRFEAADLVQCLGALPEALCLAAANLKQHPGRSLAELVEEMSRGNVLDELSEPDGTNGIRTIFSHTYRQLSLSEQRLFGRIGLLPSRDFTVEAIAALEGTTARQAHRGLCILAEFNLVDAGPNKRMRCHDLLRTYALELAAADNDRDEAVERLCAWYVHTARRADDMLDPGAIRLALDLAPKHSELVALPDFAHRGDAYGWVDDEMRNILALISDEADRNPAWSWLLTDALQNNWQKRHVNYLLTAVDRSLSAARQTGDRRAESSMRHLLAYAHYRSGNGIEAESELWHALDLSRADMWVDGEGSVLNSLGMVHDKLGRYAKAEAELRRAERLWRSLNNQYKLVNTLSSLGNLLRGLARFHESIGSLTEALGTIRRTGASGEAEVLTNMGNNKRDMGDLLESRDLLIAAKDAAERDANRIAAIAALGALALTKHYLGSSQEALGLCAEAQDLARRYGHALPQLAVQTVTAVILCDLGDYDRALALADEAARTARVRNRRSEVDTSDVLGRVCMSLGELDIAIAHHERGRSVAEEISYPVGQMVSADGLAAAYLAKGDIASAHRECSTAVAMARSAGAHLNRRHAEVTLSGIFVARGEYQRSKTLCDRLLNGPLASEPLWTARCRLVMARACLKMGSRTEAVATWSRVLAGPNNGEPEYQCARDLLDRSTRGLGAIRVLGTPLRRLLGREP